MSSSQTSKNPHAHTNANADTGRENRHDNPDRSNQVHSTSDVDARPAERIKDKDDRQRSEQGNTASRRRRSRTLQKAALSGRDGIHVARTCRNQAYSSYGTVEVPLARIKSTATIRLSKPWHEAETERGDVRDDQDESDRCYDVYSPSKTVEVPLSRIKSTAVTRQSRRRNERDGGTPQRTNARNRPKRQVRR